MDERVVYTLEQLAAPHKSSMSTGPFGSAISSRHFTDRGVPVIRGSNLSADVGLRLIDNGLVFLREEKAAEFTRSQVGYGDLVFTCWGTIGQIGFIDERSRYDRYIISNKQMKITPNKDIVYPMFLYYALSTSDMILAVQNSSIGSSVPGFNLGQLKQLRVSVPSKLHQERIVRVLTALDDKIVVNDRIATGAYHLASVHAALEISRWTGPEISLAECAEITKGVSYRSVDLVPGAGKLVTLKCVGRDGRFQRRGLKSYSGECKQRQIVEHGDIVVAQTDLTQRAEVLGRPVRVDSLGVHERLVASLDLAIVRPGPTLSREILLGLLSTQKFQDHAAGYRNGTTVLHLGARALAEFRFSKPDCDSVSRVTAIMSALLSRADLATMENAKLVELRDTLLPKLMSGELRVRDAERLLEAEV